MYREMTALAEAADDSEMLKSIASKLEARSETMSQTMSHKPLPAHLRRDSVVYEPVRSASADGGRYRHRKCSNLSTTSVPAISELTDEDQGGSRSVMIAEDDDDLEAAAMQRLVRL